MPATFSSRVLLAPDVDAASIDDGDFLRFNAATGKIEGQSAGGAETDPVAGAALAAHEADAALDGGPHGLSALTADGMAWVRQGGALVAVDVATEQELTDHAAEEPAHGGDLAGAARPPTAHVASHKYDGADPLLLADLALDSAILRSAPVSTAPDRRLISNTGHTPASTRQAYAAIVQAAGAVSQVRVYVHTTFAGAGIDFRLGIADDAGNLLAETANLGTLAAGLQTLNLLAPTAALTKGQQVWAVTAAFAATAGQLIKTQNMNSNWLTVAPVLWRGLTGYAGGSLGSLVGFGGGLAGSNGQGIPVMDFLV